MPARFSLRLTRIAGRAVWPSPYVAAYCLRGRLVPYVRDEAALQTLHGSRYTITVNTKRGDEGVGAELTVLPAEWIAPIAGALDRMRDDSLPIRVGGVIACLSEWCISEQRSAVELVNVVGERLEHFTILFEAATTFAAGNRRSRAVADPALIVGSWASSWNGGDRPSPASESGIPCPPAVANELGWLLEPTGGQITWEIVRYYDIDVSGAHAPRTLYGFTGRMGLRLHHSASDQSRCWLARLARLAPFVGTGYHTQIGLGATRVIAGRQGSAGAHRHPEAPSSADDP